MHSPIEQIHIKGSVEHFQHCAPKGLATVFTRKHWIFFGNMFLCDVLTKLCVFILVPHPYLGRKKREIYIPRNVFVFFPFQDNKSSLTRLPPGGNNMRWLNALDCGEWTWKVVKQPVQPTRNDH